MARDITAEVAALYEEYPYPAHGVISRVIAAMLEEPVRRLSSALGRRRLRVLDAGCGTGEQTIGVAQAMPELEVVGVDRTARRSISRPGSPRAPASRCGSSAGT
jgi:SAM-dependent methyltransferase